MHIFHWMRFSFKYHLPNDFFVNLCSAQDINNFHDVENVLLSWPIFKTIMLKHLLIKNVISLWFLIYRKNYYSVYIATVTGICVCSHGKVREFFSANSVATLQMASHSSPVRARYGVSFVNIISDSYFAPVIVVPYVKSCYIGPCYNGTPLYPSVNTIPLHHSNTPQVVI